jgi:hypothetical protein
MESTTNRRRLLRGAALSSVAALAAIPTVADAAEPDPVVALIPKRQRLYAAYEAASKRLNAIHDTLPNSAFGLPQIDKSRPEFARTWYREGQPVRLEQLESFNRLVAKYGAELFQVMREIRGHDIDETPFMSEPGHAEARIAWWHAECARQIHLRKTSGWDDASAAQTTAWDRRAEMDDLIVETDATSWAGVTAKLAIAADNDDINAAEHMWRSAAADAERLAGGEASG